MKIAEHHAIFADSQKAIAELSRRGLLMTSCVCVCGNDMWLKETACGDGQIFRCNAKRCRKKRSIRHGSFFSKSRLDLKQQMLLIHLFSKRYPEWLVLEDYDFAQHTVVDWMRFCREICVGVIETMTVGCIRGPDIIVEIDESVIVRRKYERGRLLSTQWMFGGVERTEGGHGRCFVEFVERRSEDVLLEIIRRRIHPESRIMSDGWRAYRNLQEVGFRHDVVVHERNFVSPDDEEVHTQSVESLWSNLKRFLRTKGTNRSPHNWEYVCEFVYRRLNQNWFESLLEHIKLQYPLS